MVNLYFLRDDIASLFMITKETNFLLTTTYPYQYFDIEITINKYKLSLVQKISKTMTK